MTEKKRFSELEKCIIYLVYKIPNLTRTRIVKLLYLVDLESFKQLKHPLTSVIYKSHYYGPYSPEIMESVKRLFGFEITEECVTTEDGNVCYVYKIGPNSRFTKDPSEFFTDKEKLVIDQIISRFGNIPLKELLNYVYATPAFKSTPLGKPIKLG